MTKLIKHKCPSCEEIFYENPNNGRFFWDRKQDDECYPEYGNICEDYLCQGCGEDPRYSTLVRYDHEGKQSVIFTEYDAKDQEYYEEAPDWFWKYFGGRKWVSTDAWRGHYESTFKNGFVKIANGWVTGYPDETVRYKQLASDLFDYVEKNFETLPCPVYWLFEPTSNVFSTASEIFLDKDDADIFIEWLKENGFDPEEVERSFN